MPVSSPRSSTRSGRWPSAFPGADVNEVVALNVAATAAAVVRHLGPAGQAARTGRLEIRGIVHDLARGVLHPVPIDEPMAAAGAIGSTR